jgi:hypothetical protein
MKASIRGRLRFASTRLSAGDWVEVRSKDEILQSLNDGTLDGLPFMPQMFAFCGQRFQVFRRAHKTCDTVNKTGGRRMTAAVHLEGIRCDGAAYGGCGAACLIFWKEAWLKPIPGPYRAKVLPAAPRGRRVPGSTEDDVWAGTRENGSRDDDPTYRCQATRLPAATSSLPWWDIRQYVEDYTSGNVGRREMAGGFGYVFFFTLFRLARRTRGQRLFVRLYDRFQSTSGGVPFPRKPGRVQAGQPTPSRELDLQPGTPVRVRSHDEILDTLDGRNKNRGLYFDAEEVPYCGQSHRVRSRVDRIIDERTGKLIDVRGNTVILEDTWCMGHYSDRRMFCPRAIYPFWRETWLEREAPFDAALELEEVSR